MNVDEYGIAFVFNQNYPLNGATSLTLKFTRPDNTTFSATGAQVTSPSTDLVVSGQGTFAANQYARYVFAEGDMNQPGPYSVRLTYVDTSKRLVSDAVSFTVNP